MRPRETRGETNAGVLGLAPVAVALLILAAIVVRLGTGMLWTDTEPQGSAAEDVVLAQSTGSVTASQYAGFTCQNFATQAEAQYVYELDQTLFGDALDPNVDGIACDEAFDSDDPYAQEDDVPDGTLLNAGGPPSGSPVPSMPDGSCPAEFSRACLAPKG